MKYVLFPRGLNQMKVICTGLFGSLNAPKHVHVFLFARITSEAIAILDMFDGPLEDGNTMIRAFQQDTAGYLTCLTQGRF